MSSALSANAIDPDTRRVGARRLNVPHKTARSTATIEEPAVATNPVQFINQVRAEAAKITWPTRREVITTTIMVFIFATLTSAFFFLVDLAIRTGLTQGLRLISG
jgi:preprotein translocase subunit SecE